MGICLRSPLSGIPRCYQSRRWGEGRRKVLPYALQTMPGASGSEETRQKKGVGHTLKSISGRKWWGKCSRQEGKTGGLLGTGESQGQRTVS